MATALAVAPLAWERNRGREVRLLDLLIDGYFFGGDDGLIDGRSACASQWANSWSGGKASVLG